MLVLYIEGALKNKTKQNKNSREQGEKKIFLFYLSPQNYKKVMQIIFFA